MKLNCDRSLLVDALARVSRAAAGRHTVRILGGVRLTAADGRLTLAATDLQLTLATSLPADVFAEGTVVVPARALLAVVQALEDDRAELSAGEGELEIRSGDSLFRLYTLPLADFPDLPELREAQRLEVDVDVMLDAVRRVLRAASPDLSRPVYTGVRLTAAGELLTLTATDGYRLATAQAKLESPIELDVLVPARALAELVRLAAGEARVTLEVTANLVRFSLPSATLVARTLDGRPQDHAQILAASFEHRARVPRTQLLRAVDRAALLAERGGVVELSFGDEEMHVRARSADLGEADERVQLQAGAPTLRIGFNSRYLRDGIDLVDGEDVWFEMNDGLRPIVLRGATDGFAYLVAPLRLPD